MQPPRLTEIKPAPSPTIARLPLVSFAILWACLNFSTLPAPAQSNSADAYTFTSLAGYPSSGSADGVGDAAQFQNLEGIAVDGAGNLYVADSANHTIRKITPAGVVSTIAGFPGSSGSADGTDSNARFRLPQGIAVDSAGNLYVSDTANSTIRKIMPLGTNWVVSTLAGLAGSPGSTNGIGTNAQFFGPNGIAVDSAHNVFVADSSNSTIRKITPAGVVSTLAGLAGSSGSTDETGSNARFDRPRGIAVDSAGNLYVADTFNSTIRKITSAGVVSTLAGSAGSRGNGDGTGTNAQFVTPFGIAVDSAGNLYVADYGNNTIRKITSAGVVSTLAGFGELFGGSANGTGSNARFYNPRGIAVDSAGNLYVADNANNTIRKITSAGVVSTLAGLAGRFGSDNGTGSTARFLFPQGIAVDSAGNLYVTDYGNHTIRKITPAGVVSTIAGLAGSPGSDNETGSTARFYYPSGIAVDSAGNLYVAESLNHTIRRITPAGVVSTIAGLAGSSGSDNGTGNNARFNNPSGIAVDSAGNLYVADTLNSTIRKITSAGVVSTLAGLAGSFGSEDGSGSTARFIFPTGIAVDSAGNLYVADFRNHTIRKITPAVVVSTIAGLAGSPGSDDGTGSSARFYFPFGIAVDSAGNLYVADEVNNTIRKGVFTQYSPINPVPYIRPPMNGQLTVTLFPPEASGQWRFPWELGWRRSDTTASNLVEGNYEIEFRSLPGWLAIPPSLTNVVVTSDSPTSITNQYYPTLSSVDTNSGGGILIVNLGVNPPGGAGWRFLGDTTSFLPSGSTNLSAGTYLIEFAPVSGRSKPPSQAVQVLPGLPSYVSVSYLLAARPPSDFYLPFRVAANQVADLANYPFGFNGQLQSDIGYGSGVAVSSNVVLTAAHLVFNDQTLSYVSRAHWFFQREVGVFEPKPQAARGWYVLSGYAAQRTNDLQSGFSPDQSTPPSRNADVAALYFLQPVAGGGHGGYLPSDAVPNTWLTSTALKMLVGYPVDGSQFDDASIVPGRMYQTDPQPYPLSLSLDPVPGQQQVYTAPWFLSYPGNSGGPLYVQLNGYYYPAAVYIGTLFSGSVPYASVVRAIDSSVTNLIRLAAERGDSGGNTTGGGVIRIIPSQDISESNPAYLQLQLGPPAAVQAGAGWRLQGDPVFGGAPDYIRPVVSSNAVVQFAPVAGWSLPTNQAFTVTPGQLSTYSVLYTASACLYSISPGNASFPASGGGSTVMVTPSNSDCSWTVTNTNGWITITSGSNGVGTGAVVYAVAPNVSCNMRAGTLTIAGQSFTVSQAAGMGTFMISPTNDMVGPFSRAGTVAVTAMPGCLWTTINSNAWITITSGASGTNDGLVRYTVASNTNCSPRTGGLTIAGRTFTVSQAEGLGSFTISLTNALFAPHGGTGTVAVSGTPDCPWTTSNPNPWIVITNGSTGVGNGLVSYEVLRNTNSTARTGTVIIARQTFTVRQTGVEKIKPTVTIVSPPANARLFTALTNLAGTARDNIGLARVEVQVGSGAFEPALGTSNWSAQVQLVPGTNVVRVKSVDTSGNESLTNTRSFFHVVTAPLSVQTNGNGKVTGATNGQRLEIGRGYTLTATPSPGSVFSNWISGGIIFTNSMLKFQMASNLQVSANFVTNPFSALKGAYNGLFYPIDSEPSHNNSGFFTLNLTDKGAFTGKLLLAGATHPASGQFDLALHARKTIARGTNTPLLVDLQLMSGSDEITGAVSNAAWVSDITGDRATFNATINPATNFAGKYTMLLSGSDDPGTSPFGQGFATLTVNNAGSVMFKDTLADGAAALQTVPVAANGQVPLYVNLYAGKGSLFGWLTLINSDTNDIDGLLLWTKTAVASGAFYRAGFTNDVQTLGSRYSATNKPVLNLSNATVRLEGGNLSSPLTNDVALNALNKITVTSTNTNKLALTLSLPTGLLSGSFLNPDTKKSSPIKGVVLQQQNVGGGFFLGTNQSGAVSLGRPEDLPVFRAPE